MPHSCPKAKRDQFPPQHAFLSCSPPYQRRAATLVAPALGLSQSDNHVREDANIITVIIIHPNDYIQFTQSVD